MPVVNGILETALYAVNLTKTREFYQRLFAFEVLLESERLVALDVAGRNVLLLFEEGLTQDSFTTPGGAIPGHCGSGPTHFALAISKEDIEKWREQLNAQNVTIESEVTWPGGALSIYFRDIDQNLVELVTPGIWRSY